MRDDVADTAILLSGFCGQVILCFLVNLTLILATDKHGGS